jgi:hypothetical protein
MHMLILASSLFGLFIFCILSMYPFVRLLSSGTTIVPRAAAPVTDVQVFICDQLVQFLLFACERPRLIVHFYNACGLCSLIGKKFAICFFYVENRVEIKARLIPFRPQLS